MSRTLHNIKIGLDDDIEDQLQWMAPGYSDYRILRQSVDARRAHEPHFVYSVEVFDPGENPERRKIEVEPIKNQERPVVIVGAGPAGLFAALRLSERGVKTILLEQGAETGPRVLAISRFWRRGELNARSNVGFGEGGAGLFSDGKLITRIKSPFIPYVMQRLVQFGAPPEIEYLANPHVGSDRIRRVIPKMREKIIALGGQIRFQTKVQSILTQNRQICGVLTDSGERIECDRLILACGHSAEDMFHHLQEIGVAIEGKSFAVGLRIEHPQVFINRIQYRDKAEHPKLGAANYRLAHHDADKNQGVYSFCMCPGGYVLSCATSGENGEPSGVVTNGMSNYNRRGRFANAAVVVSVDYKKTFGEDPLAGLRYRQDLEAQALRLAREAHATKQIPAQRLLDFLDERAGPTLPTSSPSGVVPTRLDTLFGAEFKQMFWQGLNKFEQQMRGFIGPEAQLHGVESRTSCPLRVPRHADSYQSISHQGLYPTGEGAGYAGGITSAAVDGIRVAEAIVTELVSQRSS